MLTNFSAEHVPRMSKKQQTIDLLQRDIIKLHKELVDKASEIEELKFIVKILTDQLTDCRAKLEAKEAGVSIYKMSLFRGLLN